MRRRILIGIAGLVALCSCSVKEDRSDCPCWMQVDASGVMAESIQLRGWWGSRELFDETISGSELRAFHEYTVPRGTVAVTAFAGKNRLSEDGNNLVILHGAQMDSLFAHASKVNTVCESTVDVVSLNKHFTTVYLDFKDEDDGRSAYDLAVYGNVGGLDIRTLEPVEGTFSCLPDIAPERGYMFRVPRQKDDSLKAVLSFHGKEVESIPLGELIRKAGFDWSKQSLGDVSILADLPAHTFTITIMEWEGPVTFDITV